MSSLRSRIPVLALLAACCVAAPLWADDAKPARKRNTPVGTVVDSATVAANVERVNREIHWAASLDQAEAQAAREGKLVFLVHALGDLDGLTWSANQSLRAVTLSDDKVESALQEGFVCARRNILGEPWAGMSGAHETDDPAYWTTNGAGPHNMQLFVLDADGTVLHCLPGFWSPDDLLTELEFARGLDAIWRDASLTRAEKDARFRAANLAHVAAHSDGMRQRSKLQGFDAKHEKELADSDYRYHDGDFHPAPVAANGRKAKAMPELKTCDQVMHERMAARPFVAYAAFDTGAFSEYGKFSYDKKKFDGSEPWPQEQASILKQSQRKHKQAEREAKEKAAETETASK